MRTKVTLVLLLLNVVAFLLHLHVRAQVADGPDLGGEPPARARPRGRRHPIAGDHRRPPGRARAPRKAPRGLDAHQAHRMARQPVCRQPHAQRADVPRARDQLPRQGPPEERPFAGRLRAGQTPAHADVHRGSRRRAARPRARRPRRSRPSPSASATPPRSATACMCSRPTASASMSSAAAWPTAWRSRSTSSGPTRFSIFPLFEVRSFNLQTAAPGQPAHPPPPRRTPLVCSKPPSLPAPTGPRSSSPSTASTPCTPSPFSIRPPSLPTRPASPTPPSG